MKTQRIALAATIATIQLAIAPQAQAETINLDSTLSAAIIKAGADKKIYKALTGKDKPADVSLGTVAFKGKLTGLGIEYTLPNGGLPLVPTVGDMQTIENCGTQITTSTVELASAIENTAAWATSTSFTAGFQQSIEVAAEFSTPFGGGSAASTSTFSMEKTAGEELSGSQTQTRSYSQTKTVSTEPDYRTTTQLLYSMQEAKGIPYAARLLVTKDTDVSFIRRGDVSDARIHLYDGQGKDYCMSELALNPLNAARERSAAILECGNADVQRWTHTKNGALVSKASGLCLDAASGKGNHGDRLITYKCHGGDNQKWTLNDDGTITGINGRCVGLKDAFSFLLNCDGGASQKWKVEGHGEVAKGTVQIEQYLGQAARTLEIKGVFSGTFSNNTSSFAVLDTKIAATCEKRRAGLGDATAKAGVSKGAAAGKMAPPTVAKDLVVVRKATRAEVKAAKPIKK